MKTIIFKWNPAFSSYTILRFLKDLHKAPELDEEDRKSNWSVRDHDKVSEGDRFYMLKVGYGQTGIVARGTVTSDAYLDEDWSYRDTPRHYVDYVPEIMINPDGFKLLTSKELAAHIPDVEWFGGHSGIVLSDEDAATLEQMWAEYMTAQQEVFDKASDDNLFIDLDEVGGEGNYKITFDRDYDDEQQIVIEAHTPQFGKTLCRQIEVLDFDRMLLKFKVGSKRLLVKTLYKQYPTVDDLSRLCADLYNFGINYNNTVNLIDSE